MFNTKVGLVLGLMISVFLTGCAGSKITASRPRASVKGICASVQTEEDRVICLRAQEIEAQKQLKDTKKELAKLATPSEKKAIKEFEKTEERREEFQELQGKVLAQADIQGCPGSPVEISASSRVGRIFKGLYTPAFVSVRVFNKGPDFIDIDSSEFGSIVKNLCPGGRVTIFRQFLPFVDPNYVTWYYIATSHNSTGATQQSQGFYLTANQVVIHQSWIWEVQIQR